MMIEGLREIGVIEANTLADKITSDWLHSCYVAYNETKLMYEKYNATAIGQGGGGGEYIPQVGFGWTNGVVLSLLTNTSNKYETY